MTRIEVSRDVLADPASVALVLAGPAAHELWPPRRPRAAQRVVGLVAPVDDRPVDVDPPTRAGVGFTATVRVRRADADVASGRLTITPDDAGGCRMRLALACDDDKARAIEHEAARYLANVADTTRARSSAA